MSVELATAYVNIVSSSRGLGGSIVRDLGVAGDRGGAAAAAAASASMTSRMGSLLKVGLLGVGAAAGGVLAMAISKGWQRLTDIEQATAKLSGLGHTGKEVSLIMANALTSVKGTAFGLGEAASIAASAVAAGVKPGAELTRTMKLIGDAAQIGGVSMGEMGLIFNKVAATGKLTGRELNEMGIRGIPIVSLLGKTLGKTNEEIVHMVSTGQIKFKDFEKAIETGMGGAALKAGNTTSGAFKNMGAAFSRFGATLLGGVFPMTRKFFNAVTVGLDSLQTKVGPIMKVISAKMGAAFSEAGPLISKGLSKVRDVWKTFGPGIIDNLRSVWDKLVDTGRRAAVPLTSIFKSIMAAFGDASKFLGVSAWGLITKVASGLQSNLVPALTAVARWMRENSTLVGALASAFIGYKLGMMAVAVATKIWAAAQLILNAVMTANPVAVVVVAVAALAAGFAYLWTHSAGFRDFFIGMWEAIKGAAAAAVSWFKGAWVWIKDYLINPVKEAWAWIVTRFTDAVRWIGGVVGRIVTAAKTAWTWVKDYLINPVKAGWDWVVARFDQAVRWISSIVNSIVGVAHTAWSHIQDRLINPVRVAWDWVYARFSDAVTWIGQVVARIAAGLKREWDWVYDHLISPVKKAWDWVAARFSDAGTSVGQATTKIATGVRTTWDKVYDNIIAPVGRAWQWVADKFWGVIGWIGGVIGSICSIVSSAWNSVGDFITGPVARAWKWVEDKFWGVIGWIGGVIGSIATIVSNAWNWVYDALIGPIGRAWDWIIGKLEGIKNAVKDAVSTIGGLTSNISVPSFGSFLGGTLSPKAAGGMLDRGWNLVGEKGPELIYGSGAGGQVISAPNTSRILAAAAAASSAPARGPLIGTVIQQPGQSSWQLAEDLDRRMAFLGR